MERVTFLEDVIGLIPAAGKGSRLGLPYPKELFPVIMKQRYQPVAQFVVENLTAANVKHIVFVVNSSKHQLMEFFGDGHRFGCRLSYVVQEAPPAQHVSPSPGLAHGLDSAYHLARGKTVFFGMADTIMRPVDIFERAYAAAGDRDGWDVMLLLFDTDQPQKCGMVSLDCQGAVLRIVDKPLETTLTEMWGAMIWRPSFTEYLHDNVSNGSADFAEILNGCIRSGLLVRGVRIPNGNFCDVGTYDAVEKIDRVLGDSRAR